jgi:5-oxoprolinase (ATP-hydrolysing)
MTLPPKVFLVFDTETSPPTPIFFVASRGHHADIGGSTPGSMPPQSTSLRDEGAASEGFKIVSGGVFNSTEVEKFLSDPGKHAGCSAARNQADNISDLQAQIAANQKGISLVNELAKEFGVEIVQKYMGHIQAAAESAVRELLKDVAARCISSCGGGGSSNFAVLEAVDYMDDGTPIRLQVTIDGTQGSAVFDFTGTGAQVLGNCNAPKAITYSAVLYCLRCMVTRDIPMNQVCVGVH